MYYPPFGRVLPSSGILLSLVYELHVSLLYSLTYVHWAAIAGFLWVSVGGLCFSAVFNGGLCFYLDMIF